MPERNDNQDFLPKAIVSRFLRLNIAKKMLLGYLSVSAITILTAVFALSNLERLNAINRSIVDVDVPLINAADKINETLLSQELYGRRYVILKSSDMLELFWKRSEEFNRILEQINSMSGNDSKAARLSSLHAEYNRLFGEGFKDIRKSSSIPATYDAMIKKKQLEMSEQIEGIASKARVDQNEKTLKIARIGAMAFRISVVLCTFGILFGIGTAMAITHNISGSINKLKLATKVISEGSFENLPDVKTQDELGELSRAFSEMAKRLKKLEEMYLDASPLTRLPGGIAIENVLKKRIESGSQMAFCLVDLDNFKSFNDRYGYAKGSRLIQETAFIIEEAVAKYGIEEDFVGHIGGDDFVVITVPDRYVAICKFIMETFDKMIPDFYDPEDRKTGYIMGKTRQGQEMAFPIMTISIAVVTNQTRKLTNYIQVGEIAAELKEYAKTIHNSIYVVDQRRKDV